MHPTIIRQRDFPWTTRKEWLWPSHDSILWKAAKDVEDVTEALKLVPGRDVAIQAGAGGGVYPARLATEFRKVVTFEVNPLNIECCKHNLADLGNVTLIEAAVGMNDAMRSFKEDAERNCGSGYLDGVGNVPTVRIDDLRLEACDLIWFDIQGHEPEALHGAMETLKKFHPVVIIEEAMIHYMKKWGIDEKTAGKFLLDMGYKRGPKRFASCDWPYLWT